MLYALVGAGPSLDYCAGELADLVGRGAYFLLADSVAAGFFRKFQPKAAAVFSVELRRHSYLSRIPASDFSLWGYHKAARRNFRTSRPLPVNWFKLMGEAGAFPELYSPGTVLGIMLSFAVQNGAGEIHLLGADFSYIDNQVYARYIGPHAPATTRLTTQETWQYEMVLKKSGGIIFTSGHAVRTGFELMQARENIRGFLAKLPGDIKVVEYSPIGLETDLVEKRMPHMAAP